MAICSFVRHTAGKRGWRTLLTSSVALCTIFFASQGAAGQQTAPSKQSAHPVSKAPSPFADAKALLRQGKLEDAKNRIQEELQQNPSRPEGYGLLGLVYTAEKKYTEALSAFQRGLELNPKSTGIRIDMGNLYVAQGNFDLAEKEFREVVRLNPADNDGNYNLALVLLAKKQPAEAIPFLLRIHPPTIASQFSLTRAYLDAGKTAEGLKTAGELSVHNKDNVQVHFTLGVLLAGEKQLRPAQLQLEQANVLQPQTFEILYNLGQVYLRNAEYASAELSLKRALNLKPDSPETLSLLAQVYSAQRKPVDALDLLVRAHKLAPENTDIIYHLALVSMSQNYYEDSIPLLESGLKIAPQRMDLRAALGESYFMSGRAERAIEEFKQMTELDPTARSYAFLGLCYRQLGRFDEAQKYFEEGLKKDPRNPSCLFNIGYIEEHQGNHEAAEQRFQEVLRLSPNHAEALLELANLRIANKKYAEAAELLRKFVRVSSSPAPGYYKLAMVERSLHQTEAAQRDLSVFQTLSKNSSNGPYPYEKLFDYLDNRSNLSSKEKAQLDLTELAKQIQKQPDQPENLYLLAEGYLKLGNVEEARKAITQLDQLSAGDFRTQTGVGVLLARYRLYQDSIQHFQAALHANPDSDDIKFDLADAYFRKGMYPQALEVAQQVSANGQQDDAFLSLLGDIKAHLGQPAEASEIYRNAIRRNPDNDQYYLSLALLQLRQNDLRSAEKTLQDGRSRIPGSGKLLWGQGLVSVLDGKTAQAAQQLEQAVDLLPEWLGSYSTLGVFYYQTGQIEKAKEVLNRFKGSSAGGGLDVNRIAETLEKAPAMPLVVNDPMPMAARQQLLQFALSIADRTL
ncbi:MAG TPA: tetratricopeptide repeat protein [Candidatus Acidoferrum sp.]|nr:tetratricopeptide repeat protein [Candidatus Acidoferrum sp.]